MYQSRNICLFTGRLRSFRLMEVGEFKDISWGYGTLFLCDNDNPSIGQEIRIQAWEDNAQVLSTLPYDAWIKISSVYAPSEFRGQLQANFVIGNLEVLKDE